MFFSTFIFVENILTPRLRCCVWSVIIWFISFEMDTPCRFYYGIEKKIFLNMLFTLFVSLFCTSCSGSRCYQQRVMGSARITSCRHCACFKKLVITNTFILSSFSIELILWMYYILFSCSHEYQLTMGVLWKRLSDTGKNWRHVYKVKITYTPSFFLVCL